MDDKKLINMLLNALDNPRIVNKIKQISSTSLENSEKNQAEIIRLNEIIKTISKEKEKLVQEIDTLKGKTADLLNKNSLQEIENKDLSLELTNLNKNHAELKQQHQNLNAHYIQQAEKINTIDEQQKVFNKFCNLSGDVRDLLKGIFKQTNYENFIACGVQRDNIDAFWDFIKFRIINSQYTNLSELTEILYYFINLYNTISDKPTLRLQTTKLKEYFDPTCHIRTSDGKASGEVVEIYLLGYENEATNSLIKKSIVRVG